MAADPPPAPSPDVPPADASAAPSDPPAPIVEFTTDLASLPFTRGDLSILAIDDDPVQLRVLKHALEALGYKVSTACNGREALDLLNDGLTVDLIMSDVMMPVMNGPQFLAAARANAKFQQTPIVMMSSNDQYEIVFDCLSKGADDYMVKPLSPQVLKNMYANVWIKRRQNEAAAKIQQEIVDASVLTARIEEMKKTFQQNVSTPFQDATNSLTRLVEQGAVRPEYVREVNALIERLRSMGGAPAPVVARPAIPAKMEEFFGSNFGVGPAARPVKKIVAALPVRAGRKPAPAAPAVPHLQSLNLGDKLQSFDFNVWTVNENMMANLANDLFALSPLPADLGKAGEVEFFLRKAVQVFKPNPFHNFRRAIGGLQFVSSCLKRISVNFTNWEINSVLLAALLHDVDHPGTNSMFQTRTSSQIALTYNDRSVLENNSASAGWKLLQDSFTLGLDDPSVQGLRQLFLGSILKTDYSKLNKFLAKVLAHDLDWAEKEHRFLGIALLVLLSDLSFALRPWNVAEYWYGLMRDEQLQQGDMERRLGMPVAALMDRKQQRPQAMLIRTHFRVIVMPVVQAAGKVFRELEGELLSILQRNLQIVDATEAVEGIERRTSPAPKGT
jgi:CheY-like chemotaxis protein